MTVDEFSVLVSLNMLSKEQVIQAINKLPQKFSIEDVMDELLLIQKIEKGLDQSKNNDIIAEDELDNELPKWLS